MKKLVSYAAFMIFCFCSLSVFAGPTYSFVGVSNDDAGNTAIGESQMSVEVTKPFSGSEQTLFTFRNTGTEASYISEVFFFDGVLLEIAALVDSDDPYDGLWQDPDVDFEEGSSDSSWDFTSEYKLVAGFSIAGEAGSDNNGSVNGVHPGESLGVLFDLTQGSHYDDVLAGLDSSEIVIGIKVEGYSGGSESEKFTSSSIIPAPSAILLSGIGLGFVGWFKKRKKL